MNEKMDAGDIILQKEVEIRDDETTGEVWEKLAKMGASLLINTLEKIENNTAPRIKQGETYTLAPMLDKELAKIKWEEMKAYEIKNLVIKPNNVDEHSIYVEVELEVTCEVYKKQEINLKKEIIQLKNF